MRYDPLDLAKLRAKLRVKARLVGLDLASCSLSPARRSLSSDGEVEVIFPAKCEK